MLILVRVFQSCGVSLGKAKKMQRKVKGPKPYFLYHNLVILLYIDRKLCNFSFSSNHSLDKTYMYDSILPNCRWVLQVWCP